MSSDAAFRPAPGARRATTFRKWVLRDDSSYGKHEM
jgi:hypothetical protein